MDLDSPFSSPLCSPDTRDFSEPSEFVPDSARPKKSPESIKKRDAELRELSCKLIHNNATYLFIERCKISLISWAFLIRQTTISKTIRSSDAQIVAAFQTIDSLIAKQEDKFLRRLAYVQLAQVFDALTEIIAADRSNGYMYRAAGYRNATIAVDIYMSAQQKTTKGISRHELLERKKMARRWLQLAGPSPFILAFCSNMVEEVMCVFISRVVKLGMTNHKQ